LFTDWREKVPDEEARCAICGEVEDPREFNTPDQLRQIKEQGLAHLTGQLDRAFLGARKPTQHAGFITMTWSYRPGARRWS
jgi:hypothetical protein